MLRLIRANLARLWKSRSFAACLLATLFTSGVYGYIIVRISSEPISWEGMVFGFSGLSLFSAAAFAALFIGDEYSDNTIRNKLIIGRTRTQIYFANLVAVIVGGLCLMATEKAVPLLIALFGGAGKLTMTAGDFALGVLIYVCALITSCVLFSAVVTLTGKKTAGVVLTIALTLCAYAVTPVIKNKLLPPPTITVTAYDENGDYEGVYEEENPEAVTGALRTVLEEIYNTLSFGQIDQAAGNGEKRPFLPLYSLGTSVAVGTAGAVLFRRKDLK